MPKKSNKQDDECSKLITLILKLLTIHLGESVILYLETWQNELKKTSIEDLKSIYLFFLFFDYEHESIDWKKLLLIEEEMVCIMFSNITTLYIPKNRLLKISAYFNSILNGSFQKNYCKLNNLYFIYIENDGEYPDIIIKIWSKIIEKQKLPTSDFDVNDNKKFFIDFYHFFGINNKELIISDIFFKKTFGNEN
jgi:hypothetical protein